MLIAALIVGASLVQRHNPRLLTKVIQDIVGTGAVTPSPTATVPYVDLTGDVNPLVGTNSGGDVLPGASYPLGMVQWSPDTTTPTPGGYNWVDNSIQDFSLTHFSGRGCNAYQDFPFIPYVGQINVTPYQSMRPYTESFSHNSEVAHPGYYRVHLDSQNITVELAVTARTGIGRFTFPASHNATILINAGGSVNGVSASSISYDPATGVITGQSTSTIGCGSASYTINMAARFDQPIIAAGTWRGTNLNHPTSGQQPLSISGVHTGIWLTFDTTKIATVQTQVGISFTDAANALANLNAEQQGFNFDAVHQAAIAAWNAKLDRIQVQGGTQSARNTFYTALYHAYLHPNIYSDVNGDYLGFDGKLHTEPAGHTHYENISGWDSYRTLIPLRTMLDASESADIAQSLVEDAQQGDGHIPSWEQASADSMNMSGDSGDIVVAEAYAYGGTQFDTQSALQAMINGQSHIRTGLQDYQSLGYVADGTSQFSASMSLEYMSDDFAIAQFAQALGNQQVATTYMTRASNWSKLFNPATGYIAPRTASGDWINVQPQDTHGFQEGSSAQYTWMVPFDMAGLISRMGGSAKASSRLDTLFTKLNDGPNSIYAWMGNEPSFDIPWAYDFAGNPAGTQSAVRRIQTSLFDDTRTGLPGNDDGGVMSAWYVFSALGLYPAIPGVAGFTLGSPLFPSATVYLNNGRTLRINAPDAAPQAPYVAGLQVNGQASSSLWLSWSQVSQGMTLDFALATTPTSWGQGSQNAPPSFPSP